MLFHLSNCRHVVDLSFTLQAFFQSIAIERQGLRFAEDFILQTFPREVGEGLVKRNMLFVVETVRRERSDQVDCHV